MTTRREERHTEVHTETKQNISQSEIESLARCLLPTIQKFYESEEGKKEFEIWKKKQELK